MKKILNVFLIIILLKVIISCTSPGIAADENNNTTPRKQLSQPILPEQVSFNVGDKLYILPPDEANDAIIYYSIDNESEIDQIYYKPIIIDTNKTEITIRAFARKNGYNLSEVVSKKYTIIQSDLFIQNITTSSSSLTPAFNKTTYNYNLTLNSATSSVTFNITNNIQDSTVKIVGYNNLTVDISKGESKKVEIEISKNGQKKSYFVEIYRETDQISTNNNLSNITLSNGSITFDKNTTSYNISVNYSVDKITIEYTKEDSKSTVNTNYTNPANLTVGENTFTLKVTSESGSDKTYTLKVTRLAEIKSIVTATPDSTNFQNSTSVSLSANPQTTIYYTIDGTTPTVTSPVYTSSITLTDSTILKTLTVYQGSSNVQTFTYTKDDDNNNNNNYDSLNTDYYKTNPNGQVGKYKTTMNVTCTNMKSDSFSDWSSDMIIAQGVANDVAQSFKGGHEAPMYDTYALYAAWDDNNLYLGWQYVNVVDVVDPAQGYPISDNGKPWNGDIRISLAFDINPNKSLNGSVTNGDGVWDPAGKHLNKFENGLDLLLNFSSKPGVGKPGVFLPAPDDKFSYNSQYCKLFSSLGIVYGYVDGLLPEKVYGINKNSFDDSYKPEDLVLNTGFVDFLTKGHSPTKDTFYEMKIPFTALGITKQYLEQNGIGVMLISTFGTSSIGSIPYDPTVYDNVEIDYPGDASTSKEKADVDTFTKAMARIGKL